MAEAVELMSSDDDDSLTDMAIEALENVDLDDVAMPVVLSRLTGKQPPKTFSERIPRKVARTDYEVQAESIGFHTVVFKRALLLGIPGWLFGLIFVLRRVPDYDTSECLEGIEFYSGRRTIQRAFTRLGYGFARAFDKDYDPQSQDFTDCLGFVNALVLCLKLKAMGLSFWETVCSTWVFMSRASTHRTELRPMGEKKFKCVADANVMVSRMCLLIRLLAAKWCCFGLEQPSTSCMEATPRMKSLANLSPELQNGQFTRIQTYMGAFGKPCPKSTLIYGNSPWVLPLSKALPPDFVKTVNMADTSFKADGTKQVTGRAKELKESQGYTDAFGTAVYDAYRKGRPAMNDFQWSPPDGKLTSDKWADANPDSICDKFGIPKRSPW